MKKLLLLLLATLPLLVSQGQTVTADNFSQLKVHYETPTITINQLPLGDTSYLYLHLDGYHFAGTVGAPALPVQTSLLTIPFCQSLTVEVANALYDTLSSPSALRWLPLQPSLSKQHRGHMPVIFNDTIYSTNAFYAQPLASVEPIGIARDRRLAQLTFSPISINPATGAYIVCRSADITVNYQTPDSLSTLDHYLRYHSPAFGAASLNRLIPSKLTPIKSVRTTPPLRLVIVANSSLRCRALNRFVEWKRKQGLMVDLIYTSTAGITTPEAMAAYLKGLYTSASDANPAPTYLLIVGDHGQVPAFSSQLSDPDDPNFSDHITDLYFTTWTTDDILPDCYQGRFSATDTVQLTNIIRKTLLYEQYGFPDDSYLANATLVAGVDRAQSGDYAYSYADPTMDYAAHFYVKGSNGYSKVYYFKNDTAFAPSGVVVSGSSQNYTTATLLRNLYNEGMGWVNYSAHGDWDQWAVPLFNTSHVAAMTNENKPSFMIGNCCLTNKFEKPTCLGEALLRKGSNAGAVAYIGASNSTYWNEDFYWSVGVRIGIYGRINTNYNRQRQGVYDGLFHTHNEVFSERCPTAGSMIFKGCLSVNSSSVERSMRSYYWEIYHLMGDPTLMPWLGRAKEMDFAADTTVRPIRIQAPPYAYVAVVDTNTLAIVGAAFTDADGNATISIADSIDLDATQYSVSAQGYKPYFSKFTFTNDEFKEVSAPFVCFPNPATDECTVKCDSMTYAQLFNVQGHLIAEQLPSEGRCVFSLRDLPHGVYFVCVKMGSLRETRPIIH